MNFLKKIKKTNLWVVLTPLHHDFSACIIFSFFNNLLMLAPTIYMLQIFDRILISQNKLTLIAITSIIFYLFFLIACSEWLRSRLLVRINGKMNSLINNKLFDCAFNQQLMGNEKNPTQVFKDFEKFKQWITGGSLFPYLDAPWIPIYFIVIFLLHPVFGLVSIVFVLILVILSIKFNAISTTNNKKLNAEEMELASSLSTKLKNADMVEIFGILPNIRNIWLEKQSENLILFDQTQDTNQRIQCYTKFTTTLQQSLTLAVGAILVINGDLTMGAMIAANLLMGRITQPIQRIIAGYPNLLETIESTKRLENTLSTAPHPINQLSDSKFLQGKVEIKDLCALTQDNKKIIKNLNLTIEKNETIIITGRSSSGKSTLAEAILGVWPSITGEILIDSIPIQHIDFENIGSQIGYLPQDIELFNGTVAQNIARFSSENSELIVEASKRCGIHHMILNLPNGYDTKLGIGGANISGGQQQQIALARAIYNSPKLIILDEPNSNLDNLGEIQLNNTISTLKELGSTIIMISHKKNILDLADRLIHLSNGQITNIPTPQIKN
jgi:ATP-binding cassette, subfamily C, bacterial exporter for protease/lipase